MTDPLPTERELAILEVLWDQEEATVRAVHQALEPDLGIAQNTVQTFLRILSEKGLVTFRKDGRSFVYRAAVDPEPTRQGLLGRVLDGVYDGALDRLVAGAFSIRGVKKAELRRLRQLIEDYESGGLGGRSR